MTLKSRLNFAKARIFFAALLMISCSAVWAGVPGPGPLDSYEMAPCRVYDTRLDANAPELTGYIPRTIQVTGVCGVPASAKAVKLNLTVVNVTAAGYLVDYGLFAETPTADITFSSGDLRANNVIVALAGDGTFKAIAHTAGSLDLVVDINGYFQAEGPVLTPGGATATFTEDQPAVTVDPGITVTDPASLNLVSATVTITNPQNGAMEVLAATGCDIGLTVTPGLNSLSITGSKPLATYQSCLRLVTYNNTSQDPGATARSINFVANDGTSNSNTATKAVTVNAVNDAPAPAGGPFSIAENSPNGTSVGTVLANDPEAGQTHTWSILSGNTGGAFAIDGAGQITVANSAALDLETTPTFSLVVQATDNGTPVLSGSGTVVVNLTDANDAPAPAGGPFSIAENSANGTSVGTVLANDPDAGQTHTWSILSGNTNGAFAIDGAGQITVANSAALNFETMPTFSLVVQATDNGTPVLSGSGTVVVNLTNVNEAPAPAGGPFSLAENSANGTSVGTVLANDPDAGQTHTWSILSGNTNGAFAIDGSGQITVANSAALDFETTPTFSLVVQATDNGTPVLSGSGTVVVNLTNGNDAPAPAGGPFSIAENSANGTSVGTVLANDPDVGQTHTWSITSGNTGGAFAINGSGQITVANSGALNFETTPTFSLTVQATDNGTPVLSGSGTVVVNLTDVNEPPVPSGGPFSVAENSANGTTVGTVLAGDPDTGQSHTFSITAGNTGGAFAINGSGVITVANSAALNFETTPTFNLTVQATDNGTPILSGSTTVVVNLTNVNEAPVPSGGPFSLPENSANGTTVGTVLAGDPDTGQSHTFSITAGNTGGAFAINGSGVITVANSAALNFETTPTFNLTVQATDNGTPILSGSTTVVVNLTDVNEPPVPSGGPFSLPENSANGTTVGTVLAGDPDTGQSHTFSITAGNTGGAFAISGSGVITVANTSALNFETTPTFSLTVQVTDNGTPVLSGSTTVVVNLTNVNEAPVPSGGPFTIPENSPNGTSVGTVTVNDPDVGQSHTFAITAGNTGGAFAINSSGLITVANVTAVNFEATPVFNLTVQVTDNGTPVLSGSTTVTINLLNVPETPIAGDEGTPGSPYADTAGNTLLEVKAAATPLTDPKVIFIGNILTNDVDPDGPTTFTVTLESATAGAVVTVNPDGTFSYVPPPGFTGVDNFSYRITDPDNLFDTAAVYIRVVHRVWYVKNNTGTAGTAGTTADPFDTLVDAELAAGPNDTIYLFEGTGNTTGQSDGITLKNGQRLLGEFVQLAVPAGVTINGTAGRTLRTTTGNKPKIENDNTPDAAGEDNGVSVAATAGSLTGVEIRGMDIKGFDNAVDVTATGANNADVTISDNTISGSGIEGIDVNANSTGAVTLSIHDNNVTAGVRGIDVLRTTGTCTITGFANNVINGNTGGSGVEITGAIFDATPGNPINQVSGGSMVIGQSGNGVSTNGMLLTTVTGDLAFADLDIFNDAGTGLSVTSTGALNAGAGTGFRFGVTSGAASIDSNGGPAVSVNNATFNLPSMTFLRSTNSTTTGLSLVNAFGGAGGTTLSASSGQIDDPGAASGTAVNIDGGNGNITLGIPITNNSGRSVSITNRTSDTVSFTSTINDTGSGVFMNSNAGATMSYSGGLTINTGTNPAFTATSGGTVNATGSGNTLKTTSGTALTVTATTIGASGLNFQCISAGRGNTGGSSCNAGAASGTPTNGIVLNNTGSSGGLSVTGTAAADSGGTIQNTTGSGISLTNTRSVSLNRMNLQSTGDSGVNGTQVTNFTFTNGTINNAGNAGEESAIAFNGSGSNLGINIAGTLAVTGNTFTNPFYSGVDLQSDDGTVTSATISNNVITNPGFSGVNLVGNGSASTALTLNSALINQNNISGSGSNGIQISGGNGSATGPRVTLGIPNDVANVISITSNAISLDAGGTQAITVAVTGANSGQRTRTNFDVSDNGTAGAPITGSLIGTVVLIGCNGYSDCTGIIDNNVIDANHTSGSGGGGGNGIGGGNGVGGAGAAWTPNLTLTVTNNVITDVNGNGILLVGRGATGTAKLKIANNNVQAPNNTPGGSARQGIRVDAGNASSADDAVYLNMFGNTSAGSNGAAGLGVRKQGTVSTTHDFGIFDAPGGSDLPSVPTNTDVQNFINALNPAGGGTDIISGSNYQEDLTQSPP